MIPFALIGVAGAVYAYTATGLFDSVTEALEDVAGAAGKYVFTLAMSIALVLLAMGSVVYMLGKAGVYKGVFAKRGPISRSFDVIEKFGDRILSIIPGVG